MTWLTPALAGIAAAIAIPALLILYFLKLRRQEVEISSTLLWKKTIEDLQANAPFQKLRKNLLLFLQLLVLGGLIAALAQPMLSGQARSGTRNIILIDRSASMQATDGNADRPGQQTRLELAKERALELVDSLGEAGFFDFGGRADEAMVITFDTTAEVREQFTTDKAALKRAIESIEATDGPSSLDEAIRLANAHAPSRIVEGIEVPELSSGPPATLHLFTDGKLPDAPDVLPRLDDVINFNVLGQPDSANVGVTAIRADRAFDNPTKLSVFVGLTNTDRRQRTVDVELLIDGTRAAIKSATIPSATSTLVEIPPPPGQEPEPIEVWSPGTGAVVFELERTEGALIAVRLDIASDDPEADVLSTDNRAWVVAPPAKQLSVGVVTTENLFLMAALEGMPLAELVVYDPDSFLSAWRRGRATHDVVILDGWLPPSGEDEFLPPGRWLVFNAVPTGGRGLTDLGSDEGAIIIDWKRNNPILRNLVLDNVIIAKDRRVGIPDGSVAQVLAETNVSPAIIELSEADTRSIVVPFDPSGSTWVFDVSWVVFLASSVNYLGGTSTAETQARLVHPGGILTDRLPPNARDAEIRMPDGERQRLTPAADGRVVFGPVRESGIYEVTWEGPKLPTDAVVSGRNVRVFTANLLDSNESDVPSADTLVLASKTVTGASAGESKTDRKLWPWAVLAALAIVMLEWWIYNRKVYV